MLEMRSNQTFVGALRSLSTDLPRLRGEAARMRIAALRRLALAEGLHPAAALAEEFAAAVVRDRVGTPTSCWIEALRLAAACEAHDRSTGPLLLATIGARLSG